MEGSVEAGDLRQFRDHLGDRLDGREVVRLVQRGQRHQAPELRHDGVVDARRRGELHPAMDDAMAECQHRTAGQQLAPEVQDLAGRAAMVEPARGPGPFRHHRARGIARAQVRLQPEVFDLAAEQQGALGTSLVDGELDARGAGVEDSDAAGRHAGIRRRYCCRRRHRRCRR